MLDFAGNPPIWTVERLLGVKGAALLVLGVLGAALRRWHLTRRACWSRAVAGAAGFFLPDLLVYNLGLKRQEELRRGLADALDMLTVCVEAGQGFDAALMQVSRSATGPVAGEFARVLQEIQIGKPRAEAFSGFSQRTNVAGGEDVRRPRWCRPTAWACRSGRCCASRPTRCGWSAVSGPSEQAQKVTVKILFPLLLCIFPALMIVVIGPGAIRLMSCLLGQF